MALESHTLFMSFHHILMEKSSWQQRFLVLGIALSLLLTLANKVCFQLYIYIQILGGTFACVHWCPCTQGDIIKNLHFI